MVEGPDGVLLVANRRRNGRVDWSPPGGVIDGGEDLIGGLTREVLEETGLAVAAWDGPLYDIEAEAPGMGWHLRVQAHRAVTFTGDLTVEDPDGIVVDARFAEVADCAAVLDRSPRWVREPLTDWLAERWEGSRTYRYRVDGDSIESLRVDRLDP